MEAAFRKISESEFEFNADHHEFKTGEEMCSDFEKNGFVIARKLFKESEIEKILSGIENWKQFWDATYSLADLSSRKHDVTVWRDPGSDMLGAACKTVKVHQVAEDLLNRGEVYLYNGNVVSKKPRTGGALIWHQDYGYWYNNRCLFPDFVMCLIALTQSNQDNGGLQLFFRGDYSIGITEMTLFMEIPHFVLRNVLKGSQRCGRIDHDIKAGQTGADMERVALLEKVLDKVQVNLCPGDAVFFHCNLLHKSDANLSDQRRWHLLFGFNAKHNSPDREHYSAQYTEPLEKLPADAVEKWEDTTLGPRDFAIPQTNKNISVQN